jgi:MFS family permease
VFTDRVFMAFVGVNLLLSLMFMQHISTLPIAMGQQGLAPSTFGTVIAINGVLIVAGQLFVPRLLRRFSHARALTVAAVVTGLGFGLQAFAHNAWIFALAVLIWTAGEMLNAPSNSATNAELSPAGLRGRYQGVWSLSWAVASFVAPILGGTVLQYFGAPTLWLGCLGLGLIAAVFHTLAGPARERRAQALRTNPAPSAVLAPAPLKAPVEART